jgi:preprotein translocase subunit SecD
MKKHIIENCLLLLLFITPCYVVASDGALRFILTNKMIDKIALHQFDNGQLQVTIHMKEKYRKQFKELTARNIGVRLSVDYEGKTLTSAVIKDRIKSGIIVVSKWTSKKDAQRFVDDINKYLEGYGRKSDNK